MVKRMPHLANENECTGCSACKVICPKSAIKMEANLEGFLYPVITEDCIGCGKCEKICPIVNIEEINMSQDEVYAFRNIQDDVLTATASGGFFYTIAEYILSNHGIVYGVSMSNSFDAVFVRITDKRDLKKVIGSKYVQSQIDNVLSQVQKDVISGRTVLFSGTPCQIAGVKKYIGESDKLITVDFSCHSVPSPTLLKLYISMQEEKFGRIDQIIFKDKKKGYDYPCTTLYSNNERVYSCGSDYDQWLRCFLSRKASRRSCSGCRIQQNGSLSDITMGDLNNVYKVARKFDDNKGCSRIIIHTTTGKEVFDKIKKQSNVSYVFLGSNENGKLLTNKPLEYERDKFFSDASKMRGKDFFDKYFPINSWVIIKHILREFSYKLGIYRFVKKNYREIRSLIRNAVR